MTINISKVSPYNYSTRKRFLDLFLSIFFLIVCSPLFVIVPFLVLFTSGMPVLFIHKRTGKNGKSFGMIKFRTMINGADKIQKKFIKLNESDGPTFKIRNDPRFTKIGRILSRTGLDELPQFINVLKGEMSIVGPRPLPVSEAKTLSKARKVRQLVKPGCTSSWVVKGSHDLTFSEWMKLDKDYVTSASFFGDLKIIFHTFILILKYLITPILNKVV